MTSIQSKGCLLLVSLLVLTSVSIAPLAVENSSLFLKSSRDYISQDQVFQIYHGGTVESIRIDEFDNLEDILTAMENGEVDLFGQRLDYSNHSDIEGYDNIEALWAPDNTICMLAVNSKNQPLDNTYLRRALAYAIDKNQSIPSELSDYVDVLDFALPLNNQYSLESEEGGAYYYADYSTAITQLEKAGMLDVDEDSMVEGNDGSEVCLNIWYPSDRNGFDFIASQISSNLLAIGLNNTVVSMPEANITAELFYHNNTYDLAIYNQELPPYGLNWAATTFAKSMRGVPGENVANIDNSIFTTLAATYYDEIEHDNIINLGIQALRNVKSLCPVIPLFAYRWLSIYSNLNFEGWVDDENGGAISVWNPVSITPNAPSNNELVVGVLPEYFDEFYTSLNMFKSNIPIDYNWASGHWFNPYRLVYDSPIETAPSGAAVPREATSWEILYLGQIPDITFTQQRVRFYCDSNANWTDGEQFDAQDYRFTFEYYAENNLTTSYGIIGSVKITGDYRAGITLNSKYLFNYREIGALPIIPEHIWFGKNARTWEPTVQEAIGSGPFVVESYVAGSSLVLIRNEIYYPVVDTEPPVFQNIEINPTNPIPAESLVIRIYITDRSIISNVTLVYSHQVGNINFTETRRMSQSAIGYIASIPARVTADKVFFQIHATDIWGNSDIVYEDFYTVEGLTSEVDLLPAVLLVGSIGVIVLLITGFIIKRKS